MSVSDIYRAIANTQGVGPATPSPRPEAGSIASSGPSEFSKNLKTAIDSTLNLSQHAETRIRSRAIPWDAAVEKRVTAGIEQARAKGSREALILADNIAVIANVRSNTVVTAMDRTQMKDKIFTNIDSAVIV